jgi:signal peptide peptidase SppA
MRKREREALLASYQRKAWAILPEALDLLAAWASGDASEDDVRAAAARNGARTAEGVVVAAGGVAVIPLRGVITPAPSLLSMIFGIGTGGLQGFRASLREALGSEEVSSIVIDVDSPGGLSDLVPETAAEIRAAREQKPIVAVANTMAASAAYWLASQASEFVVTPSGTAGSIGVYAVHEDWSRFNEDVGVKPTYVTAGKHKAEMNPDEPLSDTARGHLQEMVDAVYGMFTADVAAGRGIGQDVASGEQFGEGRMFTAEAAVERGMADGVAMFEEAVSRLQAEPPRSGASVALGAEAVTLDASAIASAVADALRKPRAEVPEPPAEPAPAPEPEPDPQPEPDPDPAPDTEPDPPAPDEPPADPPVDEPDAEPEAEASTPAPGVLDLLTA